MHRLIRHPAFQIVCVLLVMAFGVFDVMLYGVAIRLHGNDFGKFYYSAINWRDGRAMYDVTIASRVQTGNVSVDLLNMNPPHLHLLILPFTRLPLESALAIWTALNAASAVLAGMLAVSELRLTVQPRHLLPTVLVILSSAASGAILMTGQITGVLLLPLALAWRAARRGRWPVASVWLALLISIKPFLALFVPYLLLDRRWNAVITLTVTLGAIFTLGVLVFGWQAHRDWVVALQQVSWTWGRMNGSLRGLFAKILAPSRDFTPFVDAQAYVTSLWLIASTVVGVTSYFVARRSVDHAFAVLILAALLVSPLGWVYYLWLLLPPAIALWRVRRPLPVWLALGTLVVPYIALTAGQPSPWFTLGLGSFYTWGTLLLWLGVVLTPSEKLVEA